MSQIRKLKVWTDKETVWCNQYDEGFDYRQMAEAMRFKAKHIKAHADAELFEEAAGMLDDAFNHGERMFNVAKERYQPKHGHWNTRKTIGVLMQCSCCGWYCGHADDDSEDRYCSHCGACMDETSKWLLRDVYCPETYECSFCHAKFKEEENRQCDKWAYCPSCGAGKKT